MSTVLPCAAKWYQLEPLHTLSCPRRRVECMRCSSAVELHCMRAHDCGHRTYPVRNVDPVRNTHARCDCHAISYNAEDDSFGGAGPSDTHKKGSKRQRPSPAVEAVPSSSGNAPATAPAPSQRSAMSAAPATPAAAAPGTALARNRRYDHDFWGVAWKKTTDGGKIIKPCGSRACGASSEQARLDAQASKRSINVTRGGVCSLFFSVCARPCLFPPPPQ